MCLPNRIASVILFMFTLFIHKYVQYNQEKKMSVFTWDGTVVGYGKIRSSFDNVFLIPSHPCVWLDRLILTVTVFNTFHHQRLKGSTYFRTKRIKEPENCDFKISSVWFRLLATTVHVFRSTFIHRDNLQDKNNKKQY